MSEERDFPVEKIHQNDRPLFRLLYNTYCKALTSYAISLLGSREEAEDVVQEAFTAIWEKGGQNFINISHVKRFLYLFVRNKCVDTLRHKKIIDDYALDFTASERKLSDEDKDLFTEDIYMQLFRMIDLMPERQREVFLLYMKGKTNQEIADALHVSIETVKKQKQRGKEYLKRNLSPSASMLLAVIFMP